MQLTARSVSLILNAEQAFAESRLWQEKMESYVQFIEVGFECMDIYFYVYRNVW